jgi:hypothetical protein
VAGDEVGPGVALEVRRVAQGGDQEVPVGHHTGDLGAFEGESKIKGGDAPAAKPTPKLTSETVQKIKENIEAS